MTEEEYAEFEKAGGDKEALKKFMKLEKGEVLESWEKASTVYADEDSDADEIIQNTAVGRWLYFLFEMRQNINYFLAAYGSVEYFFCIVF